MVKIDLKSFLNLLDSLLIPVSFGPVDMEFEESRATSIFYEVGEPIIIFADNIVITQFDEYVFAVVAVSKDIKLESKIETIMIDNNQTFTKSESSETGFYLVKYKVRFLKKER